MNPTPENGGIFMVSGFLALTFCLLVKTEKNKDGKDRLELDNRVGKTSRQILPGGAARLLLNFFNPPDEEFTVPTQQSS